MPIFPTIAFGAATLFVSWAACAQAQAPAKASLATAEVIAVYVKEKRVLLKHGPIDELGMSDMTMEFGVASPRMLATFKRGKKVMFSAVRVKDDFVVTHVEPAR